MSGKFLNEFLYKFFAVHFMVFKQNLKHQTIDQCNHQPSREFFIVSRLSLCNDTSDVLIIGGGVTGCAIARELSKNKLDILLVDKEYDVALHSSSRNDDMVHPGIDITTRLLKKKMNNLGNAIYDRLCCDLKMPFERTGQYLCFKNSWYLPFIAITIPCWNMTVAGKANLINGKKLRIAEPDISSEAKFALFFDGAGMVCPYGLAIALAENAIDNGAKISLNTAVLSIETEEIGGKKHIKSVTTNRGIIYPKVVINAAGVFSEDIAQMAGESFFSIRLERVQIPYWIIRPDVTSEPYTPLWELIQNRPH